MQNGLLTKCSIYLYTHLLLAKGTYWTLNLIHKYEGLFDITSKRLKTLHFNLMEGTISYHGKHYPLPWVHCVSFKKEIGWLQFICILKKSMQKNEWGFSSHIVPKQDGPIQFIIIFLGIKKCLVQKSYPIPCHKSWMYYWI